MSHEICILFVIINHECIWLISTGKRRILKCLLEIHGLLMQSEQQYILNDLYITDYCVWVQGVR